VLLVGDAACTVRPHIGLGVSKAAADAASLADALAAPAAARDGALAAWEESRLRFARAALRQSRRLGSYIGGRDDALARHYREPAQVMAQVAAAEPALHLEFDEA
jgi:2-polyprenyl-6-methoxyphenol hydroxylase-like FAD-dependent oxidoreductase